MTKLWRQLEGRVGTELETCSEDQLRQVHATGSAAQFFAPSRCASSNPSSSLCAVTMDRVLSLNRAAPFLHRDEDDASSVSTDDSRSAYTHCSIVSSMIITSARSQIPDDGTHFNEQVEKWDVPVKKWTDLLFMWGLRNAVPGWDESTVANQCGVLASTMRNMKLSWIRRETV
ncbi:hypothetical protein DFH11DRAFT_1823265 [Phellopilus nigrolimitatus]|nr:hypothetical protein DFH11DRAFT_1823265 [Phellopilus nigrolimitatus]